MKKNSFYLWVTMIVAMLCVGFTSCSNDDDDVVTGEGIVGTWKITAVENHFYNGKIETDDLTPYEYYRKFNADGTGAEYEYEYGYGWEIDEFRYTYNGNTLIVNSDGDITNMTVHSLTSSTMVVEYKDTDDDGVDYMIQTFKRVSDDKIKNAK